jgi:hypothetical protein
MDITLRIRHLRVDHGRTENETERSGNKGVPEQRVAGSNLFGPEIVLDWIS